MGKGQANTGHMQQTVGGSGLKHRGQEEMRLGGRQESQGPMCHMEESLSGLG